MSGFEAGIREEFRDLAREAELLDRAVGIFRADRARAEDEARIWITLQGLASGITRLYSGCERVMSHLAKSADGVPIERVEGWHRALLMRMHQPFGAKRPGILSQECFDALDRLRAFRHRERNSYGSDLDGDIVAERAVEMVQAFALFERDVMAFLPLP